MRDRVFPFGVEDGQVGKGEDQLGRDGGRAVFEVIQQQGNERVSQGGSMCWLQLLIVIEDL